jgi:hypothetical protein
VKISNRQPARRPLRPTKIDFRPELGWELGWIGPVDNEGVSSAAFSRFSNAIFVSSISALYFSIRMRRVLRIQRHHEMPQHFTPEVAGGGTISRRQTIPYLLI